MSEDTWVVNRPAVSEHDDDTSLVVADPNMISSGYPATLHISTAFGDRAVLTLSTAETQALIAALQERLAVAR